jgi:hypothetical protein
MVERDTSRQGRTGRPEGPRLRGVLQGLEKLSADALPRYKRALVAGGEQGFSFYFPGLLTAERPGKRLLLAENAGSICVFRWSLREDGPRLDLLLAPLPMNAAVLRESLERCNDYNGNRFARVLRIDAQDAAAVAAIPGLRVRKRREQYLYSPAALADISGGRFRTIRRYVAKVEAMGDVQVEEYRPTLRDECGDLLRRWVEHHRNAHGTSGGNVTSRRVLALAGKLPETDLRGEVVRIGGRIVAFGFGGEIRPGIEAFFDAKCDPAIQGLTYFQRYTFLSRRPAAIVNDGSDVGRSGLAQLKNSMRPVAMHAEYTARQTAG